MERSKLFIDKHLSMTGVIKWKMSADIYWDLLDIAEIHMIENETAWMQIRTWKSHIRYHIQKNPLYLCQKWIAKEGKNQRNPKIQTSQFLVRKPRHRFKYGKMHQMHDPSNVIKWPHPSPPPPPPIRRWTWWRR